MRNWVIGAAAAAALFTGGAYAQSAQDFAGTWAFQSQNYSPEQSYSQALSGVAVIRSAGRGRYDVDVLAQEMASAGAEWVTSWARQDCEGRAQEPSFTITCTVTNTDSDSYQPDNFQVTLQPDGSLTGHLISANSGEVIFRRLR